MFDEGGLGTQGFDDTGGGDHDDGPSPDGRPGRRALWWLLAAAAVPWLAAAVLVATGTGP